MSRDEFPAIRYRRKPDYSLESRRFAGATEFAAEGGTAAGWARSPKEVAREPIKWPPEPAKVARAAVADPPREPAPPATEAPKRTRKPRSAAAAKA